MTFSADSLLMTFLAALLLGIAAIVGFAVLPGVGTLVAALGAVLVLTFGVLGAISRFIGPVH
jgi:hypothetical protein